jgi:hypothetical protein
MRLSLALSSVAKLHHLKIKHQGLIIFWMKWLDCGAALASRWHKRSTWRPSHVAEHKNLIKLSADFLHEYAIRADFRHDFTLS